MGIGRTAYETAGSILFSPGSEDDGGPHIFHELATEFATVVDVVAEVANATVARGVATSRGLLKLYERWLKTRNERLADALSSHGFVPPRGGGRVLS
jgi:hypothetical protein